MTAQSVQPDRYITLAIHTYNNAQELRAILEAEGVEVKLQNVNLDNPEVSAGVRVRILEKDLPFALRIVENPEIFKDVASPDAQCRHEVFVPVDFSPNSIKACKYAFSIADRHGSRIFLLHSYVAPYMENSLQLSQTLSYDDPVADSQELHDIRAISNDRMRDFEKTLREMIKRGELPPVKFSSQVIEGLPEDAIVKVAKDRCPIIIVMGTRGAGAKSRELVGSVTAEVLDSCRFPIFTVPDIPHDNNPERLPHIMMFVNLDQEDFIALDALHRLLPQKVSAKVALVKLDKSPARANNSAFAALLGYAEQHYPQCHFSVSVTSIESLLDHFSTSAPSALPDLIVVQNKKKNVFARLFNPGIAHRLLFHSDIPMMVIPV